MDYSQATNDMMKRLAVLFRSNNHKKMGEFVGGEMFILNYLTRIKATAQPNELSASMNATSARVAAILNNLEKKGMVKREINESDRRRILVTITDDGKSCVIQRQECMHRKLEHMLMELGEEDTLDSMRLLDRIIEIYRKGHFCESSDMQKENI